MDRVQGSALHPQVSASRPIEVVLGRLEKVRRTGKGWSARCPSHPDRWPSLSIAEGADGRTLLFCHGGCRNEDVVAAIGLSMSDLFPRRDDDWRPAPRRKPAPISRATARSLGWRSQFPLEWALASSLAPLPPALAKQDIVSGWDAFTARGVDIPFLWNTVQLIRAASIFTFCQAEHADAAGIGTAVRRLLREVDAARMSEVGAHE